MSALSDFIIVRRQYCQLSVLSGVSTVSSQHCQLSALSTISTSKLRHCQLSLPLIGRVEIVAGAVVEQDVWLPQPVRGDPDVLHIGHRSDSRLLLCHTWMSLCSEAFQRMWGSYHSMFSHMLVVRIWFCSSSPTICCSLGETVAGGGTGAEGGTQTLTRFRT